MFKIAFAIPTSRLVKVHYSKAGIKYAAIIPNPRNTGGLILAMLSRKIGLSQIHRLAEHTEYCPRS